MTGLQLSNFLSLLLCVIVFSQDFDNNNVDSYCGESFNSAQKDCPMQCASGTDQECVNVLGREYKCFNLTGCSDKMQNGELFNTTDGILDDTSSVERDGLCAADLISAILGCDGKLMPCSVALDCDGGGQCYSEIGCGNPLMELVSEFLFTMIGIETPTDEAAESTFAEILSVVVKPILEDSNIALNSVTTFGDSQHMGTILDVNVKFSGLYRPPVVQNLGGIIIEGFDFETQDAFVSALSNQGDYFSGVSGVLLTLKEEDSLPASLPTSAPTPTGGIQIETVPSNTPPSASVASPSPTESNASQSPTLSTQLPTFSAAQGSNETHALGSNATHAQSSNETLPQGSNETLSFGPFYLAVLIHNTPYQTVYMEEADFNKFAEALVATVNKEMGDSMTVVKEVTLGYQQLISLGSDLTATEINLSYKVSTSLSESEVRDKIPRAVGRTRKEILSLLQSDADTFPYFLEIDEIQAQNILSIGEPTSAATLPDVIPERPITLPPSPSPTKVEVDETKADQVEEDKESGKLTGPLVGDLLESDAAKAQAEIDAAKAQAESEATEANANKNVTDAVQVKEAIADTNEPGSSRAGAFAGIVIGILVCFISVGLSYRHIKKRRVISEEEREVDEEDIKNDFESKKFVSRQNVPSRRGFSNVDIEGGEKSSATSSNSPDIPMGTDDSQIDIAHAMLNHTARNRLQSKPRKKSRNEEDEISSSSSSSGDSDSDSSSSDSGSSSDESEAIKPSKSLRKKSNEVVTATKARSGNNGTKTHRRDDSTAADSVAVVAEAMKARSESKGTKKHRRDDSTAADSLAAIAEASASSSNKKKRPSKKQSGSMSREDDNSARSQNDSRVNENLDKNTLDDNKAQEIRACMNDKSLSRDERNQKLGEIKARYRVQEKAKNKNERPSITSSKSKRRTANGSRDVGDLSGKSRKNLGDGDGGKPPSGPSRRGITDEASGRKGEGRHKSTTKRKESNSSDSSDEKIARNSKRRGAGDSKRSSEKSRRRTSDDHLEEKIRERKGKGSSPEKRDSRKSSDKSKRSMESSDDEEPPERAPSRSRGSDKKRDGERRDTDKKKDSSGTKKHSSKKDSQRSKSRREVHGNVLYDDG